MVHCTFYGFVDDNKANFHFKGENQLLPLAIKIVKNNRLPHTHTIKFTILSETVSWFNAISYSAVYLRS